MDSINQQQEEENFKDLFGEEAIKKIQLLIKKAPSCFFCTNIDTGKAFSTRPMSVQKVDDEGNIWFLSANDSHKNEELDMDPSVQLLFQGSDYSDYLNIYGTATISENKEKIKELWEPILKTWFTEGVDDPRISVIKVEPEKGYYWDTKHNMAVGLINVLPVRYWVKQWTILLKVTSMSDGPRLTSHFLHLQKARCLQPGTFQRNGSSLTY